MLLLRPIVEDEESYKLLYTFTKSNNPNWKQNFLMTCQIQGLNFLNQKSMSDYEYFKTLEQLQKSHEIIPSKSYMLMKNGLPIVKVYVMMRNPSIADISLITDKKHQRKGYGTLAIKMTEQMLFKNPNILFTTITDLTPQKITSKIALNLGYTFNEDTNYFIKANPNINLEDFMSKSI